MDISSDSTLLASGSADKNLKIWGLDFGDCHRSLFAHGDSLMAVAFQPNTHYLFTAGAPAPETQLCQSPARHCSLSAPSDSLMAVAFHDDTHYVVTAGARPCCTVLLPLSRRLTRARHHVLC